MSDGEKTAVVVGVGPGLGLSLVRKFAAEGLMVAAVARTASEMEELSEGDHADRIRAYDCDATDEKAMKDLFARLDDEMPPIVLTAFNAGTFQRGKVEDISVEDYERCWRVGALGGFITGKLAAKRMKAHGEGTILFTGATAAMRGGAGFANLSGPKFALRSLAQSMARELGPENIHVAHVVIDGQILSDRYADEADQRGPDALLNPDEIAKTYWHLHTQHRSAWTQELDLRPWSEKF